MSPFRQIATPILEWSRMRPGPYLTGRLRGVRLGAGDAELAGVGDHGLKIVVPSEVDEREHGLIAEHLPVSGVERSAVLLGHRELSIADGVGVELGVGGGVADQVAAVRIVHVVVQRVHFADVLGAVADVGVAAIDRDRARVDAAHARAEIEIGERRAAFLEVVRSRCRGGGGAGDEHGEAERRDERRADEELA